MLMDVCDSSWELLSFFFELLLLLVVVMLLLSGINAWSDDLNAVW